MFSQPCGSSFQLEVYLFQPRTSVKHNFVDESTIIYTSFQGVVVPVSNQAHVQYQALKVNAEQLIAYAKYLQNK